jgi:hypothetical protein
MPHHVQVFEFVELKELYYAGSHGMDILVSSSDSETKENDVSSLSSHFASHGRLFRFINLLTIFPLEVLDFILF